jgi:hypothetical protein
MRRNGSRVPVRFQPSIEGVGGEGVGHRPAHVRDALASNAGRDTQDEARAALHRVRIPQARRSCATSRGNVLPARLTRGRSPATLAVIRSAAELRSLQATSRLIRDWCTGIATGARAALRTDARFAVADGPFGLSWQRYPRGRSSSTALCGSCFDSLGAALLEESGGIDTVVLPFTARSKSLTSDAI